MTPLETNQLIWRKFHVHAGDHCPIYCWEGGRDRLAELFAELGYTTGAEIGVERGLYSRILCLKNPNLKLKCIDPWDEYYYYTRTPKEKMESIFAIAKDVLKDFNVEIVRKKSVEASKDIENESLDFIYIDAIHDFDHVIMDLIHWEPKVKKGGIVSGHDYKYGYKNGVIQAVDVYTRVHAVNWYYITKDEDPSFFWVKE